MLDFFSDHLIPLDNFWSHQSGLQKTNKKPLLKVEQFSKQNVSDITDFFINYVRGDNHDIIQKA